MSSKCPRCKTGLVYTSYSYHDVLNVCTTCGASHAPRASRDSLDRQMGYYKETKGVSDAN